MKHNLITCDICGKEMTKEVGTTELDLNRAVIKNGFDNTFLHIRAKDICHNCFIEITDFLISKIKVSKTKYTRSITASIPVSEDNFLIIYNEYKETVKNYNNNNV